MVPSKNRCPDEKSPRPESTKRYTAKTFAVRDSSRVVLDKRDLMFRNWRLARQPRRRSYIRRGWANNRGDSGSNHGSDRGSSRGSSAGSINESNHGRYDFSAARCVLNIKSCWESQVLLAQSKLAQPFSSRSKLDCILILPSLPTWVHKSGVVSAAAGLTFTAYCTIFLHLHIWAPKPQHVKNQKQYTMAW